MYARSIRGKNIQINLDESPSTPNDIKHDSHADKSAVKNCLDKLCQVSNQIVKTQLKLDKLNLALKQLNILQTIRLSNAKNVYFQVEKNFIKNVSLEIAITNRTAQLDNDFKRSYLIISSIQLNKALFHTESFYWLSKCEQFCAIKPNSKHVVDFDLVEAMKNKFFPFQINIYLIFDTQSYLDFSANTPNLNEKFLFESNKRSENFLKEFSVCIYQSKFSLSDYFVNSSENLQVSSEALEIHEFSMEFNLLMNCNKQLNASKNLDSLWARIGIQSISQDDTFFLSHLKGSFEVNLEL